MCAPCRSVTPMHGEVGECAGEVTEYVYDSADRVLLTRRYATPSKQRRPPRIQTYVGHGSTGGPFSGPLNGPTTTRTACRSRDERGGCAERESVRRSQADRSSLHSVRVAPRQPKLPQPLGPRSPLAEVRPGEGAGDMKTLNFLQRPWTVGRATGRRGYFSESTFDAVGNVTSTIRYSIKTSGMAVDPRWRRYVAPRVACCSKPATSTTKSGLKQRVDPQGLNSRRPPSTTMVPESFM